jgi:hypothetical protein
VWKEQERNNKRRKVDKDMKGIKRGKKRVKN